VPEGHGTTFTRRASGIGEIERAEKPDAAPFAANDAAAESRQMHCSAAVDGARDRRITGHHNAKVNLRQLPLILGT
jgi:hypothetical protein